MSDGLGATSSRGIPGVPGADPDVPTLAQSWVIASIPPAEVVEALVDAFGETMRVPLRRFSAHDETLRDAPTGSWLRSRAKALELLRNGHKGCRIAFFGVSSYNHGGYNWFPESHVYLSSTPDGSPPRVTVTCERVLTADDDAGIIATAWARIVAAHLDLVEDSAPPIVGRRVNGEVVEFRSNI